MSARAEKGGGTFQGIKLLLCENPLPPIEEAIAAAQAEAPASICVRSSRCCWRRRCSG